MNINKFGFYHRICSVYLAAIKNKTNKSYQINIYIENIYEARTHEKQLVLVNRGPLQMIQNI